MELPENTNNANNQQRSPALAGAADPKRPRRPVVSFMVHADATVNPNGTVDVTFRIPANFIPGISGNLNISAPPLGNPIMGQGQSQPRAHGTRSVSTTAKAAAVPIRKRRGTHARSGKKRTIYTREQRELAIGLLNGGMPCREVARRVGRDCGSGTPIRWRQEAARTANVRRELAGILLSAKKQTARARVVTPQVRVPNVVEEDPANGAAIGDA